MVEKFSPNKQVTLSPKYNNGVIMKNNSLLKYYIMFVAFAVFITAEVFASMIVVTTTSDEASDSTYGSSTGAGISLREAVMQASNNPGDDDIFLNSGSTYTLTIAGRDEDSNLTGDIDINDSSGSVTIYGKNAIVQSGTNNSNGIDRMFHIVSGTVYINRITFRYGLVTGSTWTETGGAIHNYGTTTIKNCTFYDNSSEYAAGACSNRNGGTLNLIQCTIYNNSSNYGGASYNGGSSQLNISNCSVSSNTASSGYGLLYNDGNVDIMNTTVYNCHIYASLYCRSGTVIITNSLIEGALSIGSGVINSGGYNIIGYIAGGTFNQASGDIVGTEGSPANIGINTTLTNNGGPTYTHALLNGSNGHDSGTSSGAPLRDQRGYSRSNVDRGAYEYGGTASSTPTDINLSNNSVAENSSSGTTVGTLTETDSDSGETYTFALVPGTGSTDNDSFYIDGNLLKTNDVFDYETKIAYSIRIWVDDGIDTYEKQMSISVSNIYEAPTDIYIDASSITENSAINTLVGNLSSEDADSGDTHTYSLIAGTGDTNNDSFTISGNQLKSNEVFDYEIKNTYSIRISSTDNGGSTFEKALTISITDLNEIFVIHPSTTQNQSQNISIPLTMNNISNMDIRSIELNISYDPAVLTATGLSLTGTVLENQSYLYEFNTDIPGIIYALLASDASHFTGTGLCLYLDFTVIGASGETSVLTITTAILNNQSVMSSNGIFTVAPDAPPMFTGIIPQTMNEDASLSTSLTINDYESNPCDLTLTITSSDETLVQANTISYTCMSGSYNFSITPVANQNGLVTITIIAEDFGGLTASASFDLTVVSVNDAPVISANNTLTMNEDISSAFSLTATDIETAGCSLGITWQSSDSSILLDDNISYTCTGDVFHFSLTPVENQFGNVTLSFTITDAGSFTETHGLDITVVEVNDTPLIGNVANQSTDNRTSLYAISITATDAETATCSLTLSLTSSDTNIFASNQMTYICTSDTFYMSFTPSIQYFGTTTITATATDAGGLSASTTFDIEVTSTGPNYAPVIGARVDRWMDINPRYTNGIWAADENNIFVVGNYGGIFHYDGTKLTPMYSSTKEELNGIWGTSPTDVYCVGMESEILHYDGRTWTHMIPCVPNGDFYAVWGLDADTIYASGYGEVCQYSGTTWLDLNPTWSVYFRGIWGTSETNMYFSRTSSYYGIKYDGTSWSYLDTSGLSSLDVWGTDASNIWFACEDEAIFHYDGSTITVQLTAATRDLNGIWGSDSNNIFALGDLGSVKYYNGSSWSEIGTGTDSFEDVWGIDANQVYAVTNYGKIYKYTGTTFEMDYQSIVTNVFGIWMNSPTDMYISGYDRLYHYDGSSFTEILGNSNSDLYDVWSDGSIAWAVGKYGYVCYYDGSTFTRDTSVSGAYLYGIWGTASNDVFAVGDSGTVRYYNGSTWSVMTSNTTENLKDIDGIASNNVISVGENGTIIRYNGSTWSSESSGVTDTLNGIWINNANDIYAVGNNGTVIHYNGSSWQQMETVTARNLNSVWGNGSGDIYCVGDSGNILHYNGSLWDTTYTGENQNLLDINGSGDTVILVGDNKTVKKLYGYDYSETIAKSIAVNVSNEPIPIHLLDYNGDTVTVSAVSSDQSILPDGNISITGAGTDQTILVSPLTDQYGTLTLTVSVDDGLSQTTTYILLHVSQPPVISTISPQNMDEDTVFKMALPITDADDDLCGLSVRAFSDDSDLIREMVTDCENGNYTLTIRPVPSQSGITTITITAKDASNAYTEQSFSLTVNPINNAPKIGVSSDRWTAPMRRINQIKSISDGSVVAVNDLGKLYHYLNNQWHLEPTTTKDDLHDIWGSDANNIYAVGYTGKIVHFDGSSWTPETSNTTDELFGIWGSAANDVFAVGRSGKIMHYDGSSWSQMTSNTTNYLYDVDGNASNDVFACGNSGTILHYDGSTWSVQTSGTTTHLNQILCFSTNAVFAKGDNEILYYDGSWSIYTAANTVQALWGNSATDVYAVGNSGKIYHFDGSSWSEMTSNTTQTLMDIWGRSATDIYAVGYGIILNYDGISWSEMPQNLNQNFTHVTGTNEEVFAASFYGIYKYNGIDWSETSMDSFWEGFINSNYSPLEFEVLPDNRIVGISSGYFSQYSGNVWTSENTGISNSPNDMWSDGTVIYIVGSNGKLVYYDGSSWSDITTGVTNHFYSVWGTRKDNIYIAAHYGKVFHYDGTTFTEIALKTTETLYSIWGSGFSDIYVGAYQELFHYDGQQWEQIDGQVASSSATVSIHGRHSRDIYIGATNGSVSYYDGNYWSSKTTGTSDHFRTIWYQKSNEIYAAGDSGLLAQSDGQSFTIIDPIVFGNYSDIDGGADYVIATGNYENLIRYAPIISIPDQTLYADSLVHSIPFVVSDPDGDSVDVSVTPSSLTILSADSISISGTGPAYALLITPTIHSFLPITITISAYDGSLTQNENFMLYLRKLNTPPELAIIPNIGTAAGEISFTFVETDGDTVSLTVTSSDQSLINDANIEIVGGTGNTTILATSAYIEQNVTIQLTQESNVHGLATITVTASATGGTVTETFNVIVSPPGSGNALNFDGDDDFISFGSINGSHPLALAGSNFSMSFWIKPSLTGDSFQRIIDKSTAGLAADGYCLCLNAGNTLKFYLNGLARFTTETNILTANMWHYVVVTADGSQYKCYVNGIAVGLSTENSVELPPNATANLYIGTWYTESTREFNGQMDEISIWNIALSETDVRDNMCKRLTGDETGLVAYFRFDHVSGTTLTDLSGNDYHGTLTNMDNTNWVTSEIPLGDSSSYDYTGSVASDFSVSLSHSDGDAFTAFGDSGTYTGLHVYLVNEAPSTYTAPAGFSTLYTDHYFGVFPVGTNPTYSIAYNYSGNTSIASETGLRLTSRSNNSGTWSDNNATLNTALTTLSKTGISAFSGVSATEFIPGINETPVIGNIAAQTIDEDTVLESISITISDAETASCGLDITFTSSDLILIPSDNISYTCTADTYYLTITPAESQTGLCYISVTVTDAGGLSSSGTMALTVTDVNDAPAISSISDQTTSEDVPFMPISVTATDIEDAACSMDISIISSDTSIIPSDNISYTCTASTYTLGITPAVDQNGMVTITITVTDSGALTAVSSFNLTVTAVNDAPTISLASPANLLVNPDAETGDTSGWTITENGGSGWNNRSDYAHDGSLYGFITSNGWCRKNQVIDLLAKGYSESMLDSQPSVYIEEWAKARQSDDSYQMKVELRDGSQQVIASYDTGVLTVNSTWELYSHTFQSYGTGLRYIYFEHGGRDSENWAGTYGSVMDDAVVSLIFQSAIDEDMIYSMDLSVSDTEGDSLTLTTSSSDTTLVSTSNIVISGTGASRTITITPTTNECGNVTITVSAFDGNLTTTTSLALTVNCVNDAPIIAGTIADQTTLEDIATNITSFTVTDDATAACSMTLTLSSSDQSLLPDEYLLSVCNGDQYSIVATPAMNQYGTAIISVTIADAGGLAASTSFRLTVTDVDDSIYMWANNQAADVVLGQSDFSSNYSGTTNSSFHNPTDIAVDPTTGKVFISERTNNRILRFSSISATVNGSSAEAVLGQADFTSNLANRGGSVAANTLKSVDGVWVDSFGHLWVADRNNHRILRFNNASSKASGSDADAVLGQPDFTTNTSGTTQNTMKLPNSVCLDPAGRLWVADSSNNRVLRFDNAASKSNGANADGVLGQLNYITNTSGTTQNTFSTAHDVYVDSSGNLFVADFVNARVLGFDNAALKANGANADRVFGQSNYVSNTELTTENRFNNTTSAILDHTGSLYVSDFNNNRVMIFNDVMNKTNGSSADYVIGQPDFNSGAANNGGISDRSLYGLHWMYFDKTNNHLWGADFTNNRVLRYTMMVKTSPVMSLISDSTMNEDTVSNAISFTVTDINEQALTITYASSDESIISSSGITFSGDQVSSNGGVYTVSTSSGASSVTLTVTPETNQYGTALITITVTDPDGMTAAQSFALTVNSINDIPEISLIADQTTNEDTAINSISFTVADLENAPCSMDITLTSSDESIVPNVNLSYVCNNNSYTITATPAADQNGNVVITVTISDTGLLTATTSFALSIINTSDAPVISSIDDQSTIVSTATSPINLTVTDVDGDNLTLTAFSSDTDLVAIENMTFSGTTANRTLTITPATSVIGSVTITILVSDSQGLTSTSDFVLTIMPEIAYPVTKFSGGSFQSLMMKSDGTVWAWGYNTQGQIGDGTTTERHSPVQTNDLTDAVDISGGRFYSLALKSDGNVWGWGENGYYQLGDTTTTTRITPVQSTIINNVVAIDSGQHHNIVLKNDGTVWSWGYNDSGQLGDGTTTNRTTAIQVAGLNNVSEIATGYSFAIALKSDGTVWGWGANSSGQLGDGTTTNRLSPVQVSGLSGIIAIECSTDNSLALKNDGTVWGWGSNTYGQLGDNSTTDRSTPVQVSGLNGVTAIAAYSHSVALKNDGTVWAWGSNGSGQLGNGTTTDSLIPVQMPGVANVEIIGVGPGVTMMMKSDGTVWSCGNNQYGAVGDGTTTNRSTPVQILSYSSNYIPVISLISNQTIDEDTTATIPFISSDLDSSACTMSVTITSSNPSLIPDGNLSYVCNSNDYTLTATPIANENGIATITVLVTDSSSATASRSFDLTVTAINDPPILGTIVGQTSDEDSTINVSVSASDLETSDCNNLDITIVSSNIGLIPDENISYTCSAGTVYFSLTPVSNQSGILSFTITIADAENITAITSFDLTITTVNDIPVIGSIADQTIDEDTSIGSISLTVTDIEDTTPCSMDITITSSDLTLIPNENISYTCSANTYTLSITPAANQNGMATITFMVTDSGAITATRSFDITVTAVNDVPEFSNIASQTMNEGSSIDLTITTSDIEGSALTVTALSADQILIPDSNISILNDGNMYTITITPVVAQAGITEITISVSDGSDITSLTFMVTVNEINYIIAGHVSNYTDIVGSDLQGVTMTLSGTHSYSMVTDASGYYTFTTVRPGDYTLTASKTDEISLDIADAIKVLNARARIISLTCLEQIAADANIDGYNYAFDAAKIAHYVAGYNNCVNDSCTFWQFVTENITSCGTWPLIEFESVRRYTDLTGDASGQDFIGIGCGNVSE
ncbi:F-box associated region domain protein [Candidatus Magnetomorum sp. HK-1]|nr:F-box associated region domain protein [Candidatus Magnetomorum sp. HK-1]